MKHAFHFFDLRRDSFRLIVIKLLLAIILMLIAIDLYGKLVL